MIRRIIHRHMSGDRILQCGHVAKWSLWDKRTDTHTVCLECQKIVDMLKSAINKHFQDIYDKGEEIMAENIDQTIAVRDAEYGGFENMAMLGQALKDIARGAPSWDKMTDVQKEALDMIFHKAGRLLSGNPNNLDGWHDIQGYAKLVEDRLPVVLEPVRWDAPGQIVALLDAPQSRFTVVGHDGNTSFLKSHQSLGPPYIFIQSRQLLRVEDAEDGNEVDDGDPV